MTVTGTLARADELLDELRQEYDTCLGDQVVSDRAIQLTHEVCERLRSILDRTANNCWRKVIAPTLDEAKRDRALVYFPIADTEQGFRSILGRWLYPRFRDDHQSLYEYLESLQSFRNGGDRWLSVLGEVTNKGKHIDLVPQKKVTVLGRTKVTGAGGGSVSWGPGVTFGSGVSIMGAPVDPKTQRIVPTTGVHETREYWVSFILGDYGVNALDFCLKCRANVGEIVTKIERDF